MIQGAGSDNSSSYRQQHRPVHGLRHQHYIERRKIYWSENGTLEENIDLEIVTADLVAIAEARWSN
jgi:hypothetical protein